MYCIQCTDCKMQTALQKIYSQDEFTQITYLKVKRKTDPPLSLQTASVKSSVNCGKLRLTLYA